MGPGVTQRSFPRPLRPYLFLPDGWADGYRSALSRSNIDRVVSVMGVGDSFMQGVKATDIMGGNWMRLVRNGLASRGYPIAGEYFMNQQSDDVLIRQGASYRYGASPSAWPSISTVARSTFVGTFGDVPMFTDTGVPAKMSYLDPETGYVDHDILYMGYATLSDAWEYSVDGGAYVPVNTVAGQVYAKIAINGLAANVAHSIDFGNQSVSQRMFVAGVLAWKNRTRGIFFGNLAQIGRSLLVYTNNTSAAAIPPDPLILWGGWDGTNFSALGPPSAPDLFIFGFGINDAQSNTVGRGPVSYKRTLERWIEAIRRGNPNAAVLIIVNNFPSGRYSDNNATGTTNAYDYPTFIESVYQVAENFDCAIANFQAKWGPTSIAEGFQGTDFHPSDAGNIDMANTILRIL